MINSQQKIVRGFRLRMTQGLGGLFSNTLGPFDRQTSWPPLQQEPSPPPIVSQALWGMCLRRGDGLSTRNGGGVGLSPSSRLERLLIMLTRSTRTLAYLLTHFYARLLKPTRRGEGPYHGNQLCGEVVRGRSHQTISMGEGGRALGKFGPKRLNT